MNDVYLQISMTTAQLDFESGRAQMDIRQPAPQLTITRHKGGVTVQSRHPQLVIEGDAARAVEGRKSTAELIGEAARQGMQDAQDAAVGYNAEGNAQAASVARGKLARAKAAHPHFQYAGISLAYTPFQMPHFYFTDNSFQYSAEPDRLEYSWSVHPMAQVQLTQSAQLHIRIGRDAAVHIQPVRRQRLDTRA